MELSPQLIDDIEMGIVFTIAAIATIITVVCVIMAWFGPPSYEVTAFHRSTKTEKRSKQ